MRLGNDDIKNSIKLDGQSFTKCIVTDFVKRGL